jgi:hypothetical protein
VTASKNLSAAWNSFQILSQPSWPHPLPQVIFLPAHFQSCFQLRVTPFDLFTWPVRFRSCFQLLLRTPPLGGAVSDPIKGWWWPLRRQLSSSYVCEYIRPIEIKPLKYLRSLVTTNHLATLGCTTCRKPLSGILSLWDSKTPLRRKITSKINKTPIARV